MCGPFAITSLVASYAVHRGQKEALRNKQEETITTIAKGKISPSSSDAKPIQAGECTGIMASLARLVSNFIARFTGGKPALLTNEQLDTAADAVQKAASAKGFSKIQIAAWLIKYEDQTVKQALVETGKDSVVKAHKKSLEKYSEHCRPTQLALRSERWDLLSARQGHLEESLQSQKAILYFEVH